MSNDKCKPNEWWRDTAESKAIAREQDEVERNLRFYPNTKRFPNRPQVQMGEFSGTDEEWPERLRLQEAVNDPPRFPLEALPDWLCDMVEAVAESTQTPPELAGSLGLGVLALAGAGKVRVEIKAGWWEPLNLFFAVALPPGCRKSAVFSIMTRPLVAWEQSEHERLTPTIAEMRTEHDILETRLASLKRQAAKGDAEAEQEAGRLAVELAGKMPPVVPRLFTGDCTPEAMGRLLAEQDGRLALLSAEGGEISAILAGRYSRNGESNMEIVLKAHAGDAVRIDRASQDREPVMLDHPVLTMVLCVQPAVLEAAWECRDFGERGLLARILWVLPKNPLGSRNVDAAPVPCEVLDRYEVEVSRLLALPRNVDEGGNPPNISLTGKARELLRDCERRLEPDLGPDGRYEKMSGWFGKLVGAVARIAGGLHLADGRGLGEPIDADIVKAALALGRFYAAHAERVYRTFGATPDARTAGRISDWIKRNRLSEFAIGDLYRAVGLRKAEAIEAIELLQETGHVRLKAVDERPGPGRKAQIFEVNPAMWGNKVEKIEKVDRMGGEND